MTNRGAYSSVPGTVRSDDVRSTIHEQVIAQSIEIDKLGEKLLATERNQSDTMRLLDKILQTTTDTANHLAALDAKFSAHVEDVARRFAEQRKDMGDICTIRHEQIDRRFEALEKQDEKTVGQIQAMGEITKVRYIRQLQNELKKQDAAIKISDNRSHGWRKYWISVIVGIVTGAITATIGAMLTSRVVEPVKPPIAGSAVSK